MPIVLIAIPGVACGQPELNVDTPTAGKQVRQSFQIPGTEETVRYWLYLPKDFDRTRQSGYPVLLFLHGDNAKAEFGTTQANGVDELNKVLNVDTPPGLIHEGKAGTDLSACIVVSPQLVKMMGEEPSGCTEEVAVDKFAFWKRDQLKALVEHVCCQFNGDPERRYCTGVSLGGFGCWHLMEGYPTFFAAGAPIAGGWPRNENGRIDVDGLTNVEPSERQRIAKRLSQTPIRAFHRRKDECVSVKRTEELVDEVNAVGGKDIDRVIYEPGKPEPVPSPFHNAWKAAYDPKPADNLCAWLLRHKRRNLPPQRIDIRQIKGIAVIGDGLSSGQSYDDSWVEFLAGPPRWNADGNPEYPNRSLNFGPLGKCGARTYNLAKTGQTSSKILNGGQADRVCELVREGKINLVIVATGYADLMGPENGNLLKRVAAGEDITSSAISAKLRKFEQNIFDLCEKITTSFRDRMTQPNADIQSGFPRLMIVGIADLTQTPFFEHNYAQRGDQSRDNSPAWIAAEKLIDSFNVVLLTAAVKAHATLQQQPVTQSDGIRNGLVAFVDVAEYSTTYEGPGTIKIGGMDFDLHGASDEDPLCLYHKDGLHRKAIGNGLFANLILEGINHLMGSNPPTLTDGEIMLGAGIQDRFIPETLGRNRSNRRFTSVIGID